MKIDALCSLPITRIAARLWQFSRRILAMARYLILVVLARGWYLIPVVHARGLYLIPVVLARGWYLFNVILDIASAANTATDAHIACAYARG